MAILKGDLGLRWLLHPMPLVHRAVVTTRPSGGVLLATDEVLGPVTVDSGESMALEVAMGVLFEHLDTAFLAAVEACEDYIFWAHGDGADHIEQGSQ